jgi:hypothetical protein
MGQPFVHHSDIIAEVNLPGFGTRRVLNVFKLYEAQELALHARFVRNLILGLEELESACREHGVRFTSGGRVPRGDVQVDAGGDVVLGLFSPTIEGVDGPLM